MKQSIKLIVAIALLTSLLVTGCSAGKKVFCGCPNEHGMVGYK
jgi:outer membrane murein-binding lipoprotein Lpp